MNNLVNFEMDQPTFFLDSSMKIDKDIFVANYKDIMLGDNAERNIVKNMEKEFLSIDLFLQWLARLNSMNPLDCDEHYIKEYRKHMLRQKQYKVSTVSFVLTAIRYFYQCAKKLHIIQKNPAQHVRLGQDLEPSLPSIQYMSADQLELLIRTIPMKNEDGSHNEECYRDRLIIAMMSLEGLRAVEIKRMSVEDIDWDLGNIIVHGKDHNELIYPRDEIMKAIHVYLIMKKNQIARDKHGTPVFTVVSNNNRFTRLSRQSIRNAVNFWFQKAGIQVEDEDKKIPCQVLRSTYGMLLHQECNDVLNTNKIIEVTEGNKCRLREAHSK